MGNNYVFDIEEHPRHAYIFVPRSNRGISVNIDLLTHLGRLGNKKSLPESIYLSLRNKNSFDKAKTSLRFSVSFCDKNYILLLPSFDHNYFLTDIVDGRSEEFNSIGYVARYKESGLDVMIERLKSMDFGVETFNVG